jgi:hypothetical protein
LQKSIRDFDAAVSRMNRIESLRILEFELPRTARYTEPKRLLQSQHQVCSQSGEDGVIREIFRRIGTIDRVFVEIGVGNGCENNTAYLLSQGWTGFWVDACDEFVELVQSRSDLRTCLKWSVTKVTRENIATLFKWLGVPTEFDLFSLDIDQNTYYAWEGTSAYRPRVVVLEYNSTLPADVDWKVNYDPNRVWDGSHNFGASLKACEKLGRELGYSLVGCESIGCNAFFVRDDLIANHFARPFTAENHYEPPRFDLSFRRSHCAAILDRFAFREQSTRPLLDTITAQISNQQPQLEEDSRPAAVKVRSARPH